MQGHVEGRSPRVFLCFAAADHAEAERLGRDLRARGVGTVDHGYQIGPGANIVLAADRAMTESDYFVLLWSEAARDQPWIDEQWSAAFVRDMREKHRRFFFVVRLDETPLRSTILAARPHVDACRDWDAAVAELVATWAYEGALEHPALPAPNPPLRAPELTVYVRNTSLNVYLKLEHVPADATGGQLQDEIRAELQLPPEVSKFGGKVGLRFSYRFLYGGEPLPEDKPLASLGLGHRSWVELEVGIEPFGPDGGSASGTFLSDDEPGELNPALLRMLVDSAFAHLRPGNLP
ncbi:TIR domain-containing protein [Streptomyces winkii]|uniref:TIR domain-containing protein n=1 Tax=Streptomyces winkii TaxID=3051178 RepID=UPI0028D57074|nr:TIR domain-containing protein [Streptomyces sp. DSM 40971]